MKAQCREERENREGERDGDGERERDTHTERANLKEEYEIKSICVLHVKTYNFAPVFKHHISISFNCNTRFSLV